VSLTTAHRLIGELVLGGALRKGRDGRYVVGRKLWDLGLLAPVERGLREIASPFLHDIYGATLATVHLGMREGTSVLYLDRISGHASVRIVSQIGTRLPLHATGIGKVLLAFAPEQVQDQALRSLVPVTPNTLTDPDQVRAQLAGVLRNGYAQTEGEMSTGACSLGVPIRHRNGQVIAALGVVVPNLRRGRSRLVSALEVAAQGISRSL
jgi:DNA-binding IclR family transcriptional regulator